MVDLTFVDHFIKIRYGRRKMMRKRTGKAARWLLTAAASYIIFFLISLLLRQVSPDAMGLTWEKHNYLCMLVMLLGPIYCLLYTSRCV